MLITVLPNILDIESYQDGHLVVIVGGTHGPGTLASGLLIRNAGILRRLRASTENLPYWQALFTVNCAVLDDQEVPVSLDEGFEVAEVRINEVALSKWHSQIGRVSLLKRRRLISLQPDAGDLSVPGECKREESAPSETGEYIPVNPTESSLEASNREGTTMNPIRPNEVTYPTWLFVLLLAGVILASIGVIGTFIHPGLLTSGAGAIGFTFLWAVIGKAENIYECALKTPGYHALGKHTITSTAQ